MARWWVLGLLPMAAWAEGPEIKWDSWALSSLLVIGAILVLGWILRRLRSASFLGGSRQLKIVASLSLGQRERIIVVQVGSEQRLLGVTAQQISDLGPLAQPLEAGEPVIKPSRVRNPLHKET